MNNHDQCKGCVYDYIGGGGCRIFHERPMDWKKPVPCWLHPDITEPLPPEAFPGSVRTISHKAAKEQME